MPFRILSDNLAWRITPSYVGDTGGDRPESTGYETANLFDGTRVSGWKTTATSSGAHYVRFDAGLGLTETPNVLALGRVDRLAQLGGQITVEWTTGEPSSSGAIWAAASTAFPATLATGLLYAPARQDWVQEWCSSGKRGWRVGVLGSTAVGGDRSIGELLIGARTEVPYPGYAGTYGVARTHQGAVLELQWNVLTESDRASLAGALTAVTPAYPAEQPVETAGGSVYGGRGHWLYDPAGLTLRTTDPTLLHVLCLTPEAVQDTMISHRLMSLGPITWRQLV